MKKSNVAISAFFLFLIHVGDLILPLSQSTLAKNIVVITKKERSIRSANSYVKEGIKKGKHVNYEVAVIAFSQSILIDEFHSIAYYNRGFVRMNLNDYEGAISDYDKAIKPFIRLDSSRNQNIPGSGLGLSISQDITSNHGGKLVMSRSNLGGLKVKLKFSN